MLRGYGHFRRGRPGIRGRFVQIESRLSFTGIKADEWIPVQPGTEGILALGIAHMIIKEGLYHKEFISGQTFGFDTWTGPDGREHSGFKGFVLAEYEPNVVSKKTGVPIDQLIRVAREFSSSQASLAIGYRDRPFHQMAVAVLNGLVGNIDASGGVLIPRSIPYQPLPSLNGNAVAKRGNSQKRIDEGKGISASHPYLFAKNTLSGKPYKPKVLFLYYTDPLFSNPDPGLFEKAFQEIPLVVSFSPYMDDSARFSDLVLPDHTPLERWQDDPGFLNNGFPVLGIRQPVVSPLYQTKATGDFLLDLARSLGGQIQKAFPWSDFKEVMMYSLKGVFEAKRGDTFGLQFDEAWTRLLQRGGWSVPSYQNFEEFSKLLLEKGGWWDPVYDFGERDRTFRTPSKKFEFFSQGWKKTRSSEAELKDESFLPHWEEPKVSGDEKEYPLLLHVFRTMSLTGGRNANQPWLQEIAGQHLFERWRTWVEINPETAKRMSISDGDWVWVESQRGKIKVKARLYKGAMPGIINIPFGQGHSSGGRWSKGIGQNPYRLIGEDLDPITGYPIHGTTRVKVYKV
jgi:anaerobic selenocysteine-containing dehydrogenase